MAVEVAREAVARAVGWRGRLRRGGGDGGGGDGEGGGGEGGSQASCSMLLTGVHPPLLPPHKTTQRSLPSEQMALTVEPQPQAVHWYKTCWFVVLLLYIHLCNSWSMACRTQTWE